MLLLLICEVPLIKFNVNKLIFFPATCNDGAKLSARFRGISATLQEDSGRLRQTLKQSVNGLVQR